MGKNIKKIGKKLVSQNKRKLFLLFYKENQHALFFLGRGDFGRYSYKNRKFLFCLVGDRGSPFIIVDKVLGYLMNFSFG